MKRLTLFSTACLMAVLGVLTPSVRAQQPDTKDRTFVTFSNSVELPGVTLQPGTYEFRIGGDSRDVVQVLAKDDPKVMGQWTFVQAQRDRTSEDTVVMFKEAREGSTPAVYWFYPGEKVGKEFIYPKDQAQRIASRTGQSVQSSGGAVTPSTENASTETGRTSVIASAGAPSDQKTASDLRNAEPTSQPSAAGGSLTGNRGIAPEANASAAISTDNPPSLSAENTAQAPPAVAPSPSTNRGVAGTSGSSRNDADAAARPVGTSGAAQTPAKELPKTASTLPLSGLIGALSLMAALSLRALRA